ncbi:hypothetical protein QQZ08_000502 [Neonectria magnoliae]|uniref:Methyltransferase type 11 domain-containing protein n=1 Tax=Neonectria magnoliae TaxID=2732573 RepID=A0ABR1IHH2_9HYPO
MHGSIDAWDKFYRQIFKFLKPGGWFQHIEPDLQMQPQNKAVKLDDKHIFSRWAEIFRQVGAKMDKTLDFSDRKLGKPAKTAGFANIDYETQRSPDKKMRELGTFVSLSFSQALDGFVKLPLCEVLGWSLEEMQLFAVEMRRALLDPKTEATGFVYAAGFKILVS